ncbi:hypothetical protein [Pseudoclavibacter sp. VKM Ac-2888]|uniref:hypothetical protein n=1 Tax=Pseudoclavibacter sp. VKM Ac-2888 TaxID=2783830 RepID=UPI00188C483C|nr:hypothetical protein [Pseudoclavibacter sp. VKM Ac-2888]MBF4549249.1 hypothetical protein [Pseudoclavibacter sp. VKM Ac-2888]
MNLLEKMSEPHFITILAWIGGVGAVATVVSLVFLIAGYFKSNPKKELRYELSVKSLVVQNGNIPGLEVSFSGLTLPDPHLVELRIWSRSRVDIETLDFDAGKPVAFMFGIAQITVIWLDSASRGGFAIKGGGASHGSGYALELAPQLIKKGSEARISVLTSEEPNVHVINSLKNIAVSDADKGSRLSFFVRVPYAYPALMVAAAVLGTVLAALTS